MLVAKFALAGRALRLRTEERDLLALLLCFCKLLAQPLDIQFGRSDDLSFFLALLPDLLHVRFDPFQRAMSPGTFLRHLAFGLKLLFQGSDLLL